MAQPTVKDLGDQVAELTAQIDQLRASASAPIRSPSPEDIQTSRTRFGYRVLNTLLGRTREQLFVNAERMLASVGSSNEMTQAIRLEFANDAIPRAEVELLAKGASDPVILPITGTDKAFVQVGDALPRDQAIESVVVIDQNKQVVAVGPRLAPLAQPALSSDTQPS